MVRDVVHAALGPEHSPVDPATPPLDPAAEAIALQILEDLGVPKRRKFTPSQLAQDVGGRTRSWQRACQIGEIGAVRIPGGWIVTWRQLVRYFAEQQNVVAMN